jgi:hypothetical protein
MPDARQPITPGKPLTPLQIVLAVAGVVAVPVALHRACHGSSEVEPSSPVGTPPDGAACDRAMAAVAEKEPPVDESFEANRLHVRETRLLSVRAITACENGGRPQDAARLREALAKSDAVVESACRKEGRSTILAIDPTSGESFPDCPASAPSSTASASAGQLTRAAWESASGPNSWPSKVDAGQLRCVVGEGGAKLVIFDAGKKSYAVNGAAKNCVDNPRSETCRRLALRSFDEVWRDDPKPPPGMKPGEMKVSVQGFIAAGLSLCGR